MPPKGLPRPPEDQLEVIRKFVEDKGEQADRSVPPNPGRVTAKKVEPERIFKYDPRPSWGWTSRRQGFPDR